MTRLCQLILCLATSTVALTVCAQPAQPDISPSQNFRAIGATNRPPPPPAATPVRSPVTFFRQLLSMPAAERLSTLTNRTPEARARILVKVHEYLLLSPDERELRLRSTDLRWYLIPLFRIAATNRQTQLDRVPEDMLELVKCRLAQWDLLPPTLQQEFLANEHTLPYFAHVETSNSAPADSASVNIASQFNQFFELTPAEKQQALNTLSDAERAQMEMTLKSFEQLSARQRLLCVKNYARFADMSATERADFLRNADHWSKMSPEERQTWRDLVVQVPLWPPVPRASMANLMPPSPSIKPVRPGVATN
jgi:hypothetical protein